MKPYQFVICFVLGAMLADCALFTAKNVKTVLDFTQMACALSQVSEQDSKTIAIICGIDNALVPELEKLLAAKREAVQYHNVRGLCY